MVVTPVILAARGSRNPLAAQATWALARRVGALRAGSRVKSAFLNVEVPDLRSALAKEAALAYRGVVVVPLLLGEGRTARVTVAARIESAREGGLSLAVSVAEVIGPVAGVGSDDRALELVVAALLRRLKEASVVVTGRHSAAGPLFTRQGGRPDAIVLAAAGSGASRAMQTATLVSRWLGTAAGVPCQVAFTSIGTPSVADAIGAWRARGATQVAVATYLLAPGALYDRVASASVHAGGIAVSAPLGDAPEVAELVLHRADGVMR
jgi:sirohydrochlorin ferrochelatase